MTMRRRISWVARLTAALSITAAALASGPLAAPLSQAQVEAAAALDSLPTDATAGPSATPFVHIVSRGENLYRLAIRYGVPLEALIALNALPNPNRLYIGQLLLIPAPGSLPPSPTSTPSLTLTPILPTATETASPTATSSPTPTPTATFSATATTTPTPTLTSTASATAALTAAATPTPNDIVTTTPGATYSDLPTAIVLPTVEVPTPSALGGIPLEQFIVIPEAVRQNIGVIYARGQALNRNPHAFSKLGDSTIENPHFLARFDGGSYNLGDYTYLQRVIDYYAGSFGRDSIAVQIGLHTWSVFDPMWAYNGLCEPREHVLSCEIRLNNPALLFIRLGSNDAGIPGSVERSFRQIIEFCLVNGVIPVMGTKADRFDGTANINNTIMRELAAEYAIPLWDYDVIAGIIPGRGLTNDNVHMTTFFAHDWTSPVAFERGHGVHNLTALMMLDAITQIIQQDVP